MSSLLVGRSYTVTATATWAMTTAMPNLIPISGLPATLTLTVRPLLEGGEPHLLIGIDGAIADVRARIEGGFWNATERVEVPAKLISPALRSCIAGQRMVLTSLELRAAADGVTGTATGGVAFSVTDEAGSASFTAELAGRPDQVPPQLTPSWGAMTNPLALTEVTASEPLLPGAALRLSGESRTLGTISLFPSATGRDNVFTANVALSPGDSYTLMATGLVDLDGNLNPNVPPLPPFMVLDPGLFPQDGFESGAGGTLEGNAEIATDGDVISGQRSLRIFGAPHGVGGFTARLAVPPGASAVRATLVEAPNFLMLRQDVEVSLGVPGYPIRHSIVTPAATAAAGAVSWPLPEGATSELLFRITTSGCELGAPVVRLDDLRVE